MRCSARRVHGLTGADALARCARCQHLNALPGRAQSDRFTRLAQLRNASSLVTWPPAGPLNNLTPLFGADFLPPTNGALMTAMGLLNSVYLPKGLDDASGIGDSKVRWVSGALKGRLRGAGGVARPVWRPLLLTHALPSPVCVPQSDWTLWAVLRDHKLKTYYYRTANSPQWQAIHLDKVIWGQLAAAKRLGLAPLKPKPWAVDVSSAFTL